MLSLSGMCLNMNTFNFPIFFLSNLGQISKFLCFTFKVRLTMIVINSNVIGKNVIIHLNQLAYLLTVRALLILDINNVLIVKIYSYCLWN